MGRWPFTEDEKERGRALVDVLTERRLELEMVAEDLAIEAGLRIDTLRNIENRKTYNPGFFTIAALSGVLELGLDDLAEAAELALRKRKRTQSRRSRGN